MKRRELFKRSLAGAVGAALTSFREPAAAAALREFPADYDASRELSRQDWTPAFLSPHQNETLIALSEQIIPETDTPGARSALVNRFIDKLLSAQPWEVQKEFLESLAFIDGEARRRHGAAYIHLEQSLQSELLTFLAYPHNLSTWGEERGLREGFGHLHFRRIKDWVSRAFYSSEIGMKELGWDESPIHGPFQGCTHEKETHQ